MVIEKTVGYRHVKIKDKTYKYGWIRTLPPELIGKKVYILTEEEYRKLAEKKQHGESSEAVALSHRDIIRLAELALKTIKP